MYCARKDETWNCTNERQYLLAKVGGRELSLSAPREIMSDAYGVARYIMQSGRFDSSLKHNMRDVVSIKPRYFIHIQVEPAGANTFKVFDSPGWIYVVAQVTEGRTTYREISGPPRGDVMEGATRDPLAPR